MASTGTALYPATTQYPNTNVYPGQGVYPLALVMYSLADADANPVWVDATSKLRAFDTRRGRANELSRVDAGTATITLDNRTRLFDPVSVATIRPMNRWWIREQFSGVTQDIFNGYAESYQQVWPDKSGNDAVAVVSCVDEFKVLALDRLPTTDPPRDTYQDVVMFDNPVGYWPMDDLSPVLQATPVIGEILTAVNGLGYPTPHAEGAIVGQEPAGYLYTSSTWWLRSLYLQVGESGDAGGLSEFTIEAWIALSVGLPAFEESVITGPGSGATYSWKLTLTTGGLLKVYAKNSGGTDHTVTGTTALVVDGGWYHVVGTITGGNVRLYVNGVQEASTAFTGAFGAIDATSWMSVGSGVDISTRVRYFDEIAFYRAGLPAARVAAHFNAGRYRGFPREQDPGVRIAAVLDAAGNSAPRNIRTGTRAMTGAYMTGQDPLSELRRAETADAVDAVLFIAKDGTITFLDDGHRSSSPWNTVQATFDDDGTDLPYTGISVDYSESFLANKWDVTKSGGTTTTASDTTSITRYFPRPQSLADLPITTDADVTAIAAAMLAKYKDPMQRVVSLTCVTANIEVAEDVFALDIGSRVRVFRTPPGGGTRIDQTAFVQSIEVTANATNPVWTITLGVSPL